MQVSCSSCGAKYEFDASAIPAAGYDAQCTTCNAIFFVSPDADGPPSAPPPTVGLKLSEQVAVSCNHCGAVYQFAAADIPQEGYDAQCTQCQGVFFVSVAGAAKVQPSASPEKVAPSFEQSLAGTSEAAAPTPPGATPAADTQTLAPPADGLDAASGPGNFSTPHDIPTVSDDDYASMSQVIAMERLEAKKRESTAQSSSAAPAPQAPRVESAPLAPETPASSPEGFVSGEGAAVLPESSPVAEEKLAPKVPEDAGSPELNPIPSWGVTAPEMAALSGEPEALAAPDAAMAASTPVPPSAAETGVGPLPAGFVGSPAATTSEPLSLESFSLSNAPDASEPPPPPEPHADEPAANEAHSGFGDDHQAPSHEDTSADLHMPTKAKSSKFVIAASIAVLALGGAAFGLWRTGMLAGQAKDAGEEVAAAAAAVADKAETVGSDAVAKAKEPDPAPAAPAVSSKARVAFERGMHSLLDDTIAGYTTAQEAFREALKIEPTMVDAHAGIALQALLGGEDYLALGHAEWAEAKRLEGIAAAYQAKLLGPVPRGRHGKELERERLRMAEAVQQVAQVREKAILHLQIGEDTLQNGAMMLLRGSMLPNQTPLMRTSVALWLASDPYLANPGESTTTFNAARAQFTEAARWLAAPGEEGTQGALPAGADAKDPWARTWLSLAKARILAAKPTTAVQMQPFLETAITREPHFMRGRWEIARALEQAGHKEPAHKAAENLLTVMPTHEKAKALLESLKASDAPAVHATDKPAPKVRGRGHRSKRGR